MNDEPREGHTIPRTGMIAPVQPPPEPCPRRGRKFWPASVDLLVVSPTFYPEPIGTPFYATDAVRWFAEQGFSVAVLTAMPFYPQFERYDGYGRHCRYDDVGGVPVYRVPTIVPKKGAATLRALSDANFMVQALLALWTRRLPRPRAVLTFSPGTPLAVLTGRAAARGARHIVTIHDLQTSLAAAVSSSPGWVLGLMRRMERWCLERGDGLLVLSQRMKEAVRDLEVRRHIDVAPIWIDSEPKDNRKGQQPLPGPIVMYSGNLGRKQGAMQLIEIASQLAGGSDEVRLIIQGEGPLREGLAEAARIRGFAHVDFRPLAPKAALEVTLREARVHIVPQADGVGDAVIPSKIFNIMAAGRPAVVSAAADSGLAELARRSGAFVVVPPGDTVAASHELLDLISDPSRCEQMGAAGRAYVLMHHSRDQVLRKIATALDLTH